MMPCTCQEPGCTCQVPYMYPTGTGSTLYLLPLGFQGRPDKEHLSYIMRVLLPEMLRSRAESTLSGTGNVPPGHMESTSQLHTGTSQVHADTPQVHGHTPQVPIKYLTGAG